MKTFVSYHLQWHFFPVILTKGPTDCVTSRVCYRELFCPSHSVVSNSVTPWMEDRQAPLSMGFSRQEYWSEPKAFSFQFRTEFNTNKKKKKNTGVGCHFLLQGIFLTRDWIHVSCISCIRRWILYHVSPRKPSLLQPLPKSDILSCHPVYGLEQYS